MSGYNDILKDIDTEAKRLTAAIRSAGLDIQDNQTFTVIEAAERLFASIKHFHAVVETIELRTDIAKRESLIASTQERIDAAKQRLRELEDEAVESR
jgi:hypothetical protein